ncbi:hypothetical protein BYT27DRAFT_7060681, partial [Phlegmacium glaucopus]
KTRVPALITSNQEGNKTEMQCCPNMQDNKGKSKLLHEVFFYPQVEEHGVDPNHLYPAPAFEFEAITDQQIERVAKSLSLYKAPGLSGIQNAVLTHCADMLSPRLGPIFRSTFELEHYPGKWKKYRMVALRKPGKSDYTLPNAYRPITLLDVFAKLLSACVKENL